MADTKISDLTEATSLADTDLMVIAQEDTANKKVTFPTLRDEVLSVAPGFEFDYTQITADVTITGGTVEGSPITVVTAGAVTFDGSTTVVIEFFSQRVACPSVSGQQTILNLYDGSTDIGRLAQVASAGVSAGQAITASRRLTPSAASHTYSIRGWVTGANPGAVQAGAGGAATSVPAFIRIVKA